MKKFDVQMAFETVKEARQQWDTAREKYRENERVVLRRLLHESALNRLSVEDVAKFSGLTPTRVRALMREFGLDPRKSRSLLAKSAADALAVNSEMLGVAPHEVDLTSPLAYLPMGEQLREQLTEARVHRVTELDEPVIHELYYDEPSCSYAGRGEMEDKVFLLTFDPAKVTCAKCLGFRP